MLSDKALSDYRTKLAAMTEAELLAQIESHEQNQNEYEVEAEVARAAATDCAVRAALAKLALYETSSHEAV